MGWLDIVTRVGRRDTEDRSGGYDYENIMTRMAFDRVSLRDDLVTACTSATRIASWALSRGTIEMTGQLSDYWGPALNKRWMLEAAFDAILHGNAVYLVDAHDPDVGVLHRASSFTVTGGKRAYKYKIDIAHPDGVETKSVRQSEVLHLRPRSDRTSPWMGASLFRDTLLRAVERGLLAGAVLPVQRVVSYPRSKGMGVDDSTEQARHDMDDAFRSLLNQSGQLNLLESSTHRGTAVAPPMTDLKYSPDNNAIQLREQLVTECYDAVGLPRSLMSGDAPGQAARAEYHRWLSSSLTALADSFAESIAEALDVDVDWDMSKARIPIPVEQAQIFRGLAREGVDTERALRIAGLEG